MSGGQWCRTCAIPHRMDCATCFGFGVHIATVDGRRILAPVSASRAHGDRPEAGTVYTCPECGGGPTNVPAARSVGALPDTWNAPQAQE